MNKNLGNFIKNEREKLGISQRELARRINVDGATISRIENNLFKKVSVDILIGLSNQLNVDLQTLLKLNNYSIEEIENIFQMGYSNYNDILLLENLDIEDISKFTTYKYHSKNIDLLKVGNAFKNNEINDEEFITLIASFRPIAMPDREIYVTEKKDYVFKD